jgi:phospholipase C
MTLGSGSFRGWLGKGVATSIAYAAFVMSNGCGSADVASAVPAPPTCRCPDGATGYPESPDGGSDDSTNAAQRAAPQCGYGPNDHTSKTIGGTMAPPPSDLNVVVAMLENRSFDHLLSGLKNADTVTDRSNPDPLAAATGFVTSQHHETNYCISDLAHEWGPAHVEFDNGLLDGYAAVNNNGNPGARALGYYTKDDLPFWHWLGENFAVSERHFSPLIGPTWPNRLFFFKGTSCGYTEDRGTNPGVVSDCSMVGSSIFTLLRDKGRSATVYEEGGLASVTFLMELNRDKVGIPIPPSSLHEFEVDAANNLLPSFSFVGASTGELHGISPVLGPAEDDGHPPSDVRETQTFLYRIVHALTSNQDTWKKTILFITFDENGGLYDHVVPPPACAPDGPPDPSSCRDYEFNRYGLRVPLLVVSPYVTPGYISDFVTDHSSITRFIEHWLDLPAMTARDANAWPMLDFFDFSRTPQTVNLPAEPSFSSSCEAP